MRHREKGEERIGEGKREKREEEKGRERERREEKEEREGRREKRAGLRVREGERVYLKRGSVRLVIYPSAKSHLRSTCLMLSRPETRHRA